MIDLLVLDALLCMMVFSGISTAALGIYCRRYIGRIPAALPYVLLMFFISGWTFLYALDLASPALSQKVLFHNLRFIVIPFIPVLELWLIAAYLGKTEWSRPGVLLLLSVIPGIAVILALTSPWHTLFRYNFTLVSSGPVPVLTYTDSPFYLLYNTYIFLLLVLALLLLISDGWRNNRLHDMRNLLLFLAVIIPMVINYLFTTAGISLIAGVNMTTALFWIPAILYMIALFRYRFLDIIPIARNRVIEIMNIPVLVLDNNGIIADINPAASAFFSLTREAALGRHTETVIPDWPAFTRICSNEGTCHKNLAKGDGPSTRFFLGSAEPLLNPNGGKEGRLILLQDITDLKNAERNLQESENKFALAFRLSPYAITITRIPDGVILDANDGFERISGYPLAEVIGKSTQTLNLWVNPSDRETVLRDLHNGTSITGREYQFRTKSGQIITGLFSAERFTLQGTSYILSSINDITDWKRAEDDREALIGELRMKNAELDRFAYTVSHDLKSPLIAIGGFADLAVSDLSSQNPESAARDVHQIQHAVERLDSLITTLLDLSRSGKAVDQPEPVALDDLAREVAGILGGTLKARGIHVEIQEGIPAVSGDPRRLLQVILNLMDNAIKFMGDQENPFVEFGYKNGGSGPVFFMRDNGMGVPPDKLERIFDLFTRLDPAVPGTGIGLGTVRRIIEAHGGKIWAESKGYGKGTTFFFTLPAVGREKT